MLAEDCFPSWWDDESTLVVIDCGIDESGRPEKNLLVVSAVIGQTSMMKKLATAWKKDLADNRVDFFHAKDHWNLRAKAYHRLSMNKRSALLSRLIGYIHKHAEMGCSVAIDVKEYKRITSERFRSNWGAPYAFAVQMLMILISIDLQKRNRLHESVNILIEEGPHVRQACEIIGKAKGNKNAFIRVATYGCGGKKDNPILQAADLLAYGCCEYLSTGKSRMYTNLAGPEPQRFPCLPFNAELIEMLKRDISANIELRSKLRLQRLNAGLQPILRRIPKEQTSP
jgi:Protein of unknown function (DUF3800)